ncbi:hypothetical protein [Candidatus Cetobacterium colombiensis]|uniref:10 kDa chaperonin n=1 Tax=Candidatus Cetobacterium colombiensis TaxID=3073100 RepID=A0ABU4WCM7_9FUSO|nr:hypothetical protein [Candidatus Cetobacterium colombiensis]MDX8337272.1 hypothetical protein [Candidatus Cetobacterium colombiensis]
MLRPIGQRVIIKKNDLEKKSNNGIILISNHNEKIGIGIVKNISKDLENKELSIGDIIYFNNKSGVEIQYKNETYIVLEIEDIYAIK